MHILKTFPKLSRGLQFKSSPGIQTCVQTEGWQSPGEGWAHSLPSPATLKKGPHVPKVKGFQHHPVYPGHKNNPLARNQPTKLRRKAACLLAARKILLLTSQTGIK